MRVKTVLQHDQKDCAAACLVMIAASFGYKISISRSRIITKTDVMGANLYGIIDGASTLGIHGKGYHVTLGDLKGKTDKGLICLPIIAQIINEDGYFHFIVVESIGNKSITIVDPGKGRRKLSLISFEEIFQGFIAVFFKSATFQPKNERKGSYSKYFSLLINERKRIIRIVLLSILVTLIGMAGTFVYQYIIDDVLSASTTPVLSVDGETSQLHLPKGLHEDHDHNKTVLQSLFDLLSPRLTTIQVIGLGLVQLYLIFTVLQWFRGRAVAKLSINIDRPLVLGFFHHVIALPISFIENQKTGEILSRFSDASEIRDAVASSIVILVLDSIQAIGGAILLATISPKLLGLASIVFIVYSASVLVFYRAFRAGNLTLMEENARITSFLKEQIDGLLTIRAYGAANGVNTAFQTRYNKMLSRAYKVMMIYTSQETISNAIELIGSVFILWGGVNLVLTGSISIGMLVTFMMLLSFYLSPLKNLVSLQPMLQRALAAASRLNDYFEVEIADQESNADNRQLNGDIEVQNVDFRYSNYSLVLKNVSVTFPSRKRIAIVGESGSGKTTLAKLLMLFYHPERGRIQINDIDLRNYDTSHLMKEISYVSQEAFVCADTVFNNIVFGRNGVTKDQVLKACSLCQLDTLINRLSSGLDTFLEEGGANLSGGERQRLGLARAILCDPAVLVLDEATSQLDYITERQILRMLKETQQNSIIIHITHRLNVVQDYDLIIVMDNGQVVEQGSHEELLLVNGKYKEMSRER